MDANFSNKNRISLSTFSKLYTLLSKMISESFLLEKSSYTFLLWCYTLNSVRARAYVKVQYTVNYTRLHNVSGYCIYIAIVLRGLVQLALAPTLTLNPSLQHYLPVEVLLGNYETDYSLALTKESAGRFSVPLDINQILNFLFPDLC